MKSLIYIFLSILLFACNQPEKKVAGWIDTEMLMNVDSRPGDWLSLGRNYMQQHHSPLQKINDTNVQSLGFAWQYQTLSNRGRVNRGLEATPIVVDGVMYTSGAWSQVYAVNAKTGKEIWRYDPQVDGNYARRACCDVVNRGVQVWKGKVYVGTLDGFMVCLDAATGKVNWKADTFIDRVAFYTITGPPQIAGNKVIIGNSGAEFGVRGYITAYDIETGKFAWRFYTVPGNPSKGFEHPEMEVAAKTWDENSDWKAGGGGTVWGEMAYDPLLNLLYVGTGNSTPYPIWYRSPKGGDNLFLVSILAINPDDGKLAWHYQTTPGEIWDYTCTMNMILADLKINGEEKKVLMQAPKNGFFYVLDRTNGKLLSAQKFVPVNWADSVDMKTGRPVVNTNGWYKDNPKYIFPGPAGGHNWMPMSYSPATGLVYIPTLDLPFIYENVPDYVFHVGTENTYAVQIPAFAVSGELKKLADKWPAAQYDVLKAWDPVTQKEKWRVPNTGAQNGGVLSTNGNLVFYGSSNGHFYVYSADSGKLLKDIFTGTGILAAPISYEIDGDQFVAVMAGFGGGTLTIPLKDDAINQYRNEGRIIAFKLKGGPTPLPKPQLPKQIVSAPPNIVLDKKKIAAGAKLYGQCGACHGGFGKDHLSELPDLSVMSTPTHESFNDILLKGKLSYYGMANFSDLFKPEDVEALHQFLISVQKKRFEEEHKK